MSEKGKNICGEKCEVYSRVVGYFRPVQNWNRGKQEEFKMRKTFKLEEVAECSCTETERSNTEKTKQDVSQDTEKMDKNTTTNILTKKTSKQQKTKQEKTKKGENDEC